MDSRISGIMTPEKGYKAGDAMQGVTNSLCNDLLTGSNNNSTADDGPFAHASNIFLEKDNLTTEGNDQTRHDGASSPLGEEIKMGETNYITTTSDELAGARRAARANFEFANSPPFTVSQYVQDALKLNLGMYLTRPSVQRDPIAMVVQDGADIAVEYDFVHFKSSTVDEIYSRKVLHHDLALALYKQSKAEERVRNEGLVVQYAVGDAQIVLLIDHLQARPASYEMIYDPADDKVHEITESDVSTGELRVRRERRIGKPYYIRQITDERIVQAFKILTTPCIMFCVGEKVPIPQPVVTNLADEAATKEAEVKKENQANKIEESIEVAVKKTQQGPKAKKTNKKTKVKEEQAEAEQIKEPEDIEGKDYTVRPWQACAFFEDKVGQDGNLTFDTQIRYFELPYNELPTQPKSIVRNEKFKKDDKKAEVGGRGKL